MCAAGAAILFSQCLPRPPEQTNPLFENARMVQATWDEEFAQALDSALRSAGSGGPQRASPIIAALRAVAADPEFGAEIPQRRLVLVSDLLEHNPQGFSFMFRKRIMQIGAQARRTVLRTLRA
jgi:hypothetical protein